MIIGVMKEPAHETRAYGIEDDMFFQPKTSTLSGDARKGLQDLVGGIKNL